MKPGDKVTHEWFGKIERGIIKSLSGSDHAFVVYHCDENWDNYQNYTAERTQIKNLKLGWIYEETCPQCKGGGETWDGHSEHVDRCSMCGGTGKIKTKGTPEK